MQIVLLAGIALTIVYQKWPDLKRMYDGERYLDYEIKLCSANSAKECNEVGRIYRSRGKDASADSYFERSCNIGMGEGCGNLGLAYQSGAGVAKDSNRALELFLKGCNLKNGDGDSCREVCKLQGGDACNRFRRTP